LGAWIKPDHLTVTEFNQRRKFHWLRLVAKYPGFRRKALMLRLCIYIADQYHTNFGTIEFSMDTAAKALDCDPSQIARARGELVQLGWLILVQGATFSRRSYSANRYNLSGGPSKVELGSKTAGEWVTYTGEAEGYQY
jgi:hypothetical protein